MTRLGGSCFGSNLWSMFFEPYELQVDMCVSPQLSKSIMDASRSQRMKSSCLTFLS